MDKILPKVSALIAELTTVKACALAYAEAGLRVLPLDGKKRPRVARGFKAASADIEQVGYW